MNVPIFTALNDETYRKILAQSSGLPGMRQLTNLQRLIAYDDKIEDIKRQRAVLLKQRRLLSNRRLRAVEAVRRDEVNEAFNAVNAMRDHDY